MVLKVYVDLLSEPCRSVIIFLKHTEIPYEVVTVDLINGKTVKHLYQGGECRRRIPPPRISIFRKFGC